MGICVGINIHVPKGQTSSTATAREGGRALIGLDAECGVGLGNSWCPRPASEAARQAFPEALVAAEANPEWALPFAFVASLPSSFAARLCICANRDELCADASGHG